jgi:hypothetical protein
MLTHFFLSFFYHLTYITMDFLIEDGQRAYELSIHLRRDFSVVVPLFGKLPKMIRKAIDMCVYYSKDLLFQHTFPVSSSIYWICINQIKLDLNFWTIWKILQWDFYKYKSCIIEQLSSDWACWRIEGDI